MKTKLLIASLSSVILLSGCGTLQPKVEVDAEEYARLKQLAVQDHYHGLQQAQTQQAQVQQTQQLTQQQYMQQQQMLQFQQAQQQQYLTQQQAQMLHETKPLDPAYQVTREERLYDKCMGQISDLTSDNRKVITIEGSVRGTAGCVGVAKTLR